MHSELLNAICLAPDRDVRTAISCIDSSGGEIALVVDENRRLLGTITDGDIRRGLLRGLGLEAPVFQIMNSRPRIGRKALPAQQLAALMRQEEVAQLPVVDDDGILVDIVFSRDFVRPDPRDHQVIIMAGGLGTRLRPMTENLPKPMIPLGGKPILETIIERFIQQGFRRFDLCVNYRADIIEQHFGDGSSRGCSIRYVLEEKRMGTAGALSLIDPRPQLPFLVTNGDVLTTMDYAKLLEFHYQQGARATMCLNTFHYQLPYGAVEVSGHRIKRITEKPTQKFFVNAGVYCINPDVIDLIPTSTLFDMTTLFEHLGDEQRFAYPLHEYWLDIGQKPDLQKAQDEFHSIFGRKTRGRKASTVPPPGSQT